MSRNQDFTKKELERKFRRQVFHVSFILLTLIFGAVLLWKLHSLMIPICVGALMAYLFRPLKDYFEVRWLPHELRVIALFACIGIVISMGVHIVRRQLPNERQKLELKVRLKYKLNEKFQQVVGSGKPDASPVSQLIAKEAGPMIDQLNHILELTPYEQEMFLKYRAGYIGESPIEDRFFEYYQANQTTGDYSKAAGHEMGKIAGSAAIKQGGLATEHIESGGERKAGSSIGLMEELSIWILAPIIFIFLGFDNGQMRRYFIGLVPNRYFELSLTVMDDLDDAIGNYLRGTLLECFLVGLTFTIGLGLLGIPFSVAVAIGVISGLANAIPFLGTVIGLVIGLGYALIAENITPVLPGLSQDDLAVYVMVLVGIAHLLDNVVYQPFILGSAVNLHPLVVVIAIIGGSLMMGVWGMLLAIPAVVVLKTAVETLFKELKDYRII